MATKYEAVARRSGHWWAIEITRGLPATMLGVTQTHRLSDVESAARELIAELRQIDPDEVGEVTISIEVPGDLERLIQQFQHADDIERAARIQAANARSAAAAGLLDAKLTMREAAILLGISHQRVKQLADRAHADRIAS